MDNPWWFPELADDKYVANLRENYDYDADLNDEELKEKYCEGRKYAVLWDHVGEAYAQFEELADAYFELLKK